MPSDEPAIWVQLEFQLGFPVQQAPASTKYPCNGETCFVLGGEHDCGTVGWLQSGEAVVKTVPAGRFPF